jgi:hypothetical protein
LILSGGSNGTLVTIGPVCSEPSSIPVAWLPEARRDRPPSAARHGSAGMTHPGPSSGADRALGPRHRSRGTEGAFRVRLRRDSHTRGRGTDCRGLDRAHRAQVDESPLVRLCCAFRNFVTADRRKCREIRGCRGLLPLTRGRAGTRKIAEPSKFRGKPRSGTLQNCGKCSKKKPKASLGGPYASLGPPSEDRNQEGGAEVTRPLPCADSVVARDQRSAISMVSWAVAESKEGSVRPASGSPPIRLRLAAPSR